MPAPAPARVPVPAPVLSRRAAAALSVLALTLACLIAVALRAPHAFAYPPTPPSASEARSELGTLTVKADGSLTGYSREKFPHWIAQSSYGKGCDTREVVLKRDGTNVVVDSSTCYPSSGSWTSVYTGTTTTDPSKVQIDHIVPLADAWRTGASSWTTDQRQAFANDLTHSQLVAVDASSNESKGDQDPAQWKPADESEWCFYARDWISVKYVYKLTVNSAEKSSLGDMLDTC